MQTLTIEAVSRESAQGFQAALAEFPTELIETDDGAHLVKVALVGSDRAIVLVLRALEDYVTHRDNGPATVKLEDRKYTMHPRPEQNGQAKDRASTPA